MSKIKLSDEDRKILETRANFRCEYCLSPMALSTQAFEGDHIVPESKGGQTVLENLALACRGCNSHKYNRTHAKDPFSEKIVRLFDPRSDKWKEHFTWSPDLLQVVPVSSIGRATEQALQLNRKALLSSRQWLIKLKIHPPEL